MSKNFTFEEFNKILTVFSSEEEILSSAIFEHFINNFAQKISSQNDKLFLQSMNELVDELEKNPRLIQKTATGYELKFQTGEKVIRLIHEHIITPEQKEILFKSIMGFYKFKAQKTTEFLLQRVQKP